MNFRMTELRNSTSKKRTTKASEEKLGNKPSKKNIHTKKTDCHDLPSSLLAIKLMIYILRFLLRSTGNGDKLVTNESGGKCNLENIQNNKRWRRVNISMAHKWGSSISDEKESKLFQWYYHDLGHKSTMVNGCGKIEIFDYHREKQIKVL